MSRASQQSLELVIKAKADDASFTAVGQKVRSDLRRMQSEGGLRGHIESLNESIGRRSTFTHTLHALEGGGAAMGFGLLGRMMLEGSEKAKEFVTQFREGKMSAGQLTDELAKQIPLVGSFYAATRNVMDLLSGEAEKQRQLNAMQQEAIEFRKTEFEAVQKVTAAYKELEKSARQARNEQARTYLTGPSATFTAVGQAMGERHTDAADRLKKSLQENTGDLARNLLLNRERLSEVTKEIEHRRKNLPKQITQEQAHELDNMESRRDNLKRMIEVQAKRLAASRSGIAERFNQSEAAQDDRDNEQRKKALEDYNKGREQIIRESNQRIFQMNAEARQAAMRNAGMGMNAELDALGVAAKQQLDQIDQKLKEEVERLKRDTAFGSPEQIQQAQARAEAERQAIRARYEQQAGEVNKRGSEAALQQRNALTRQYLDDMEEELGGNSKLLGMERERLAVAEKFAQRREQLRQIIANEYTDAETRSAAQKELAGLGNVEARAQQNRIGGSFREAGQAMLEMLARGNPMLQRRLQAEQIRKQFSDQGDQLKAILDDPNASPEQKAQAQKLLGMLPGMQQSAMHQAMTAGIEPVGTATYINAAGGHLHGYALAAREHAMSLYHKPDSGQGKAFDELLKVTRSSSNEVVITLKEIKMLLQRGQQVQEFLY